MDKKNIYELGKALLAASGIQDTPCLEITIERLVLLGIHPGDCLELRVTCAANDGDVFALARRAVDVFFSAFLIYPNSIAVHATIASLFEASETVIKANNRIAPEQVLFLLGKGFEAIPIHIEVDDSLDVRTVAVRFKLNLKSNDCNEAFKNVLMRGIARCTGFKEGGNV